MFDIHSHILPGVDDGAENIDASVRILTQMKEQGITDVIATPHFYADTDNYEDFWRKIGSADSELSEAVVGKELPKIYIGCEVLYYRFIGNSESISDFCLNKSQYLLLELADNCIDRRLFDDIINLRKNFGIIPIIAHLERYYKSHNYKKLLSFIAFNNIPVQINASSLFKFPYSKIALKLMKRNLVTFIATDSHSPDKRPPMMNDALSLIEKKFGAKYAESLIGNSQNLLYEITSGKGRNNEQPYS